MVVFAATAAFGDVYQFRLHDLEGDYMGYQQKSALIDLGDPVPAIRSVSLAWRGDITDGNFCWHNPETDEAVEAPVLGVFDAYLCGQWINNSCGQFENIVEYNWPFDTLKSGSAYLTINFDNGYVPWWPSPWEFTGATMATGRLEYVMLTVKTVPEPSAILALLCGLSGFGGMMWRRKLVERNS